ncbi:MAG: GAF domain-containing protein, partial [Candidatus Marinimicrobia bacterium]|nr:GAF domain-containing protein [Candidatus Neomarinimicrobiota bacterium]
FLYDEGSRCIELAETTGIDIQGEKRIIYKEGEGLTGWVFAHKKPLLIQDFDTMDDKDLQRSHKSEITWTGKYSEGEKRKPKSYLAVPLISSNQIFYGIIRVASDNNNFDKPDLEILERVALYITIALVNSQHYLEERKKSDYLQLLMEFGNKLHSYYNQKDLLIFVAQQTADTFSAESCEIYLRDNDNKNRLVLRAGHGIPKKLIDNAEHKVGEGLTGTLVKEKRIIRLANVLEYGKYKGKYRKEMKEGLQHGDRLAFLGIPISVKTEVIGCLKLYNKIPKYKGGGSIFSDDDEKYLAVLGDLLAIAIENQQYLESMQTSAIQMFKTQRLTALGTVAIRIPNEVSNPLTTSQLQIKNLLRKLKKNTKIPDKEKLTKTIKSIDLQLKEVATGIKVLQDFSTKAGFLKIQKTWQEILDESLLFLSDEVIMKKIRVKRNKSHEEQIPAVTVEPNEMIEIIINLLLLSIAPLKHYDSLIDINVEYLPETNNLRTVIFSEDKLDGSPMPQKSMNPIDDTEVLTPQQFMYNVSKEIIEHNYDGNIDLMPHYSGLSIELNIPIGDSSDNL